MVRSDTTRDWPGTETRSTGKGQIDIADLHRRIDALMARLEVQHAAEEATSRWRLAVLIPVVGILAAAATLGAVAWRRHSTRSWMRLARQVRARLDY